jgi:hypothetical protein
MFETKVVGKVKIHVFPENRAVYEVMWKNTLEPDRQQVTIMWRVRVACWLIKATNPLSGYVILIAFRRQQLLCKRASMLRYTYIACRVLFPSC